MWKEVEALYRKILARKYATQKHAASPADRDGRRKLRPVNGFDNNTG
jgi:hypothetical protein